MKEIQLLASTDVAADVITNAYDLVDLTTFSIQVNFVEDMTPIEGSLKLEASLDNVVFVDVADSTQSVSNSANHIWDVVRAGYRYVRVNWDYSAGDGTIAIKLFLKENIVRFP